jgi:hypothetical protein
MDEHDDAPRRPRPTRAERSLTPTSTVAEFLEGWLGARQSLRPSTHGSHEAHIRRYLVPYLGNLPLEGLRPAHIERMYLLLAYNDSHGETPLAVAPLRRIHATLTGALNTAVERGLLDRNPAVPVQLPRSTKARPPRTEESMMQGGLQPPKFSGMVWIDGAQVTVNLDAASWGDAIDQLHNQYGLGPEWVLRADSAAVQPG